MQNITTSLQARDFIIANSKLIAVGDMQDVPMGEATIEFRQANGVTFILTNHPNIGWGAWFSEEAEPAQNELPHYEISLNRFKQLANLK